MSTHPAEDDGTSSSSQLAACLTEDELKRAWAVILLKNSNCNRVYFKAIRMWGKGEEACCEFITENVMIPGFVKASLVNTTRKAFGLRDALHSEG